MWPLSATYCIYGRLLRSGATGSTFRCISKVVGSDAFNSIYEPACIMDALSRAPRNLVRGVLAPLSCALAICGAASADNFGPSQHDQATNELVVTILYGGSNPNHRFTLK